MRKAKVKEALPQEKPVKREHKKEGEESISDKYIYDSSIHPLLIESLLQNGLTMLQVAERLGMGIATLNNWRNKYPEVKEAIRKGKEPVDARVISSLYRSAMGYTVDEVTMYPKKLTAEEIEERANMENPPPIPMVPGKIVKKQMAPNIIAQIFWLKNRLPSEWKDRSEMSVSGKVEYEVSLPPRPEELKKVGETKVFSPRKEINKKDPFDNPALENIKLLEIDKEENKEEDKDD